MSEKFRYVYTGPGGIDPQTPEEAERGRAKEEQDKPLEKRNDIPSQPAPPRQEEADVRE